MAEGSEAVKTPANRIVVRVIEDEMKKSYLDYSMSVIVGRALPDVRDGLKPVHRRVLYSMYEMGLLHNKPFKKSARIVGECFVKGTLILTDKGLTPIENVQRNDIVYTQNGKNRVTELYEMPERPVLEIGLENGISVVVTPSQKIKVINKNLDFEWKEASELAESDHVVIRATYPEISQLQLLGEFNGKRIFLNENISYILGQLLSDGWVEKGCRRGHPFRCGFCSDSTTVVRKIQKILQEEFDYSATIQERSYEIESGNQLLLKTLYSVRINSSALNEFLVASFSLQNAYAATKQIPDQILASPESVVFSFVSGLIDGDGSIHKERNTIQYCSVSEKLIHRLQVLLQHFGILSKMYVSNHADDEHMILGRAVHSNYPSLSLEIQGRFAALLASKLYLADERKAGRLQEMLERQDSFGISQFDAIPFASKAIFTELSKKHLGAGWYQDGAGKKFRAGIKYKTGAKIRYSKNLRGKNLGKTQIVDWGIAQKLNRIQSPIAKFIKEIAENDLCFLRVAHIKQMPPEKTYDIQVEDRHEFIANGLVSHNCMGKYHPHGDAAIYDTLVRMAQEFSLRYVLVDGQGNFGSIDADNAAAMRYTEARLKKLAEEILQDIDKETVDFVPNYDGSLKEPSVLPSKVPNLLINGSAGIAVGMATNIPPHNLREVCGAVAHYIDHPDCTTADIMKNIPAPDFPTGGIILGTSGIKEAYETGRGKITVRARTSIEDFKNRQRIIVTEIPYMVTKAQLIEEIAEQVKDKKIQGISDLRDESDREGMRIVIELKTGANSDVVLNQLFQHSRMQTTFGIIMLALDGNEPMVLPLKSLIEKFVIHRQEVVRKRTAFELKEAEQKAHILEGLIVALNNIDPIIAFLKKSKDSAAAKAGLIADYKLSEVQAQAILEMRLSRLTSLEQNKIKEEHAGLLKLIAELKSILADAQKILNIIKNEVLELANNYGDNRRTQVIKTEASAIEEEHLIKPEDMIVTLTHAGYVKRLTVDTYQSQRRGGKGVIAAETKEEDFVEDLFIANTHDSLLLFTNLGKVHWLKVYQIPEAGRYAKGTAIVNLLELGPGEKVATSIPVKAFREDQFLFLVTKQGTVKKTPLSEFSNPRKGGIISVTLTEGDELMAVELTDGKQEIIIATKEGNAIRFNEEDVRMMGRTAQGVIGIRLREKDEVVGAVLAQKDKTLITVTELGYGKRSAFEEYSTIRRGGVGVINIKVTDKNGKAVAIKTVNEDDQLLLITQSGIAIRVPASQISVIGRNTQGVRIIKLEEGDKVTSIAVVKEKENGNGAAPQ